MVILPNLKGEAGYFDQLRLTQSELDWLRDQVRQQWQARIEQLYPSVAPVLSDYDLPTYHRLLEDYPHIDHRALWIKSARILSPEVVRQIRRLPFVQRLEDELGTFRIANEERLYEEEIYWRLARPQVAEDVGPMHADSWFWALGHGDLPEGYSRVKIWIPLYVEPGANGLRLVPGSHQQSWPYAGVYRDGMTKPQILVADKDLPIQPFLSQPGEAILFNDDLLHGGMVGGVSCRVSLEWTLFVETSRYRAA